MLEVFEAKRCLFNESQVCQVSSQYSCVILLLVVSLWPWHISLGVLRITSVRVCSGLRHSSLLAVSCNHAPVISRSGYY